VENLVDKNFWQGKKVFLTGHTGFKGGWLSLWLQTLGADVTGFALLPATEPNLFNYTNSSRGMTSIIGDVRDAAALRTAVHQSQPEIIFHLAAQSLVRYSYEYPVTTFDTNIMGTVNLLEAVRLTDSVKAVVNITTDKCYAEQPTKNPFHENDRLGGRDPYSCSKACVELVTDAYRQSFFQAPVRVGIATARAGNVIGGGDWAQDRLVPDIMRASAASHPLQIRYPDAVRPWQFILEPLQGYLLLAKKLFSQPEIYSQAWNFGPAAEDSKTVRWVTDYLLGLGANEIVKPAYLSASDLPESNNLQLDSRQAQEKLAWKPRWDLEKALQATFRWYQAARLHPDMREFTLMQIEEYCHGSHS
jgi:CDP-glucose 4,6-dehydratase